MATQAANNGKVSADVGDPLAGIASLLTALGGQRGTTTTNAGDTSALQSVLAQLQQQNANSQALLQSIFQQAAGQIPGLQSAFGNAVGARSGNNSAVQAALSELLQQTTVAAQAQIAQQQAQNLAAQAGVGNAIAGATKGTSQKTTAGTNLGQAGAILAGLQLFGKLRTALGDEKSGLGSLVSGLTGGGASTPMTAPALNGDALVQSLGTNLSTAIQNSPDLFGGPGLQQAPDFSQQFADLIGLGTSGLDTSGSNFGGGGLMDDLTNLGVF